MELNELKILSLVLHSLSIVVENLKILYNMICIITAIGGSYVS